MHRYRNALPQLAGPVFLTDGGLETWLVFQEGIELPCFSSFPLLDQAAGRALLDRYIAAFLPLASHSGAGFILDTPTWRANADWGAKLGYDAASLARINRAAADWAADTRATAPPGADRIVINGLIGPRGDGYRAGVKMSADDAASFHWTQINTLSGTDVDMVSALTITYAEEAIGVVRAAQASSIPAVISFTVETDGRLPSGESLAAAVARVDAATGAGAAYFMINCAHPQHIAGLLNVDGAWPSRVRGFRANASSLSHAELDESTELDAGDPAALGMQFRALRRQIPQLSVLGGCCGTDHRHVAAICDACLL